MKTMIKKTVLKIFTNEEVKYSYLFNKFNEDQIILKLNYYYI